MKHSDTLDQLLPALALARKACPNAKKDAVKGERYPHATIGQMIDLFMEHYVPQGLLFTQSNTPSDDCTVIVSTRIWHVASGQFIESTMSSPMDKQGGPQGVGSATTYLRRYSLLGLMGLAVEDDDANAAMGGGKQQQIQQRPQRQQAQRTLQAVPEKTQRELLDEAYKASGVSVGTFQAKTGLLSIQNATEEEAAEALAVFTAFLNGETA